MKSKKELLPLTPNELYKLEITKEKISFEKLKNIYNPKFFNGFKVAKIEIKENDNFDLIAIIFWENDVSKTIIYLQ